MKRYTDIPLPNEVAVILEGMDRAGVEGWLLMSNPSKPLCWKIFLRHNDGIMSVRGGFTSLDGSETTGGWVSASVHDCRARWGDWIREGGFLAARTDAAAFGRNPCLDVVIGR